MISVKALPGAFRRSFAGVTEKLPGRHSKAGFGVSRARPMSVFFLDDFAVRQWDDPDYKGTRIPKSTAKESFLQKMHEYYEQGTPLVDGYAPFCKHVFVPNFPGCSPTSLLITEENQQFLQSAYLRRRPEELAVLSRWLPADKVGPLRPAKHLDVILYSREQIAQESIDLPTGSKGALPDLPQIPWGIISIKAQDEDYETPMSPITIMRNALGRSEGGSGVPLDRAKYEEAVAYWQQHALVQ